ncbi:hypothetical protein T11_5650 [Trichinella zimbabwensis]|uniref:Uncharacterized protein n=1 Tax=Trichinella zimbabwensis TaxID=268475 RepID=A0A0V1DSI3_9BILA|nr:hypothetical protein T11_5650 [Trichinella zimbabwensis]
MRNIFCCRWTPGGTGKIRPGKAAKNDFLKFLKNAQIFCLLMARQQARESCEK